MRDQGGPSRARRGRREYDDERRYATWCRENGEKPVGQQQLTTQLKNEDVGYGTAVRVDGSVQRGYKTLGLSGDVPNLADTPGRETPDAALSNYDEEKQEGGDENDGQVWSSTALVINSAQKPIYDAINAGDDGAPVSDVLEAVPHTAEKAREHIEAITENETVVHGDDRRLRTE